MSKKPSFPHNIKLNFLVSLTSWFFSLAKFRTKLLGTLKQKRSWLLLCVWGVDWRSAVFDFSIIITWEEPLHVGKITLPGILGSKTFNEPVNVLRYRFAYCIAKREQAKELETCRLVQKTPEDLTSPEMSCSVLLCPFTNKYWQLVLFVCLLLCLSSCSSRSLCDNKTSALLFSQGWWNRDDHDRPWKSESGRILNESPIKFEVWLWLFFFNSLLDFMTVLLYALRSHNCVE